MQCKYTSCNYEIINKLFSKEKDTLCMISSQFRTILLPYKAYKLPVLLKREHMYENKGCKLENMYMY